MKTTFHRTTLRNFKTSLFVFLIGTLVSAPGNATVISELYITEVMANPTAVSDSYGEWFELYNPTSESFDLNGILLSDNGSNSHQISSVDPLLINPGDYFVLGRNGDDSANGGYQADYVYSGFTLANAEDEIILSDVADNVLNLFYQAGFVSSGISTELLAFNDQSPVYGLSDAGNFGLGDTGTPGAAGSYQKSTASVPEPASLWLALAGGLMLVRRQRK